MDTLIDQDVIKVEVANFGAAMDTLIDQDGKPPKKIKLAIYNIVITGLTVCSTSVLECPVSDLMMVSFGRCHS